MASIYGRHCSDCENMLVSVVQYRVTSDIIAHITTELKQVDKFLRIQDYQFLQNTGITLSQNPAFVSCIKPFMQTLSEMIAKEAPDIQILTAKAQNYLWSILASLTRPAVTNFQKMLIDTGSMEVILATHIESLVIGNETATQVCKTPF